MICENLDYSPSQIEPDVITNDPGVQYNMGKSEKGEKVFLKKRTVMYI